MTLSIDPSSVSTPASNTAAVITFAAVAGKQHNIDCIVWSYDTTPTGGNLKIEDGSSNTVFSFDISSAGPGFIPFNPLTRGSVNTAMIVTLASGGSGVTGKLSVPAHWVTDA